MCLNILRDATRLGGKRLEPFVAKREASGVETFRLAAWENEYAGLSAGFSSRIGGVSRGAFDSLNCALHVADDPQAVLENRRRLAAAAGFPFDAWTCAEQVHGNSVTVVTKRERGMGREARIPPFRIRMRLSQRKSE